MSIGDAIQQKDGTYYSTEYECYYTVENGLVIDINFCQLPEDENIVYIRDQREQHV